MHNNWDSSTVVLNTNLAGFSIHRDFDVGHLMVCIVGLLVISCVDQDFVENLVQARYVGDFALGHFVRFFFKHPHLGLCGNN